MKKTLFALLSVAAMAVTQVQALTVTVDQVSGYWAGSGGEFNVSPVTGVGYSSLDLYNNTSGQLGFGTFCIDRNVGITVPGQYTAVVNASGITSSGDAITLGTAWLFSQFAQGTLSGYDYTDISGGTSSGRATSALNLQLALWTLQGSYSYPDPTVNSFLNLIIAKFGSLAAAEVAADGAYDVGALNLYNTSTGDAVQPMLTLLPDGGSALILLGMGLSSMALIARKFRS